MRKSGVLMHISSLPGGYSVGSLGEEARHFVDRLAEGGFKIWQVLPVCIPDEYNSPYKSISSFALNPYFLDLPLLYARGLITKEELMCEREASPYLAEYRRLGTTRLPLLRKAARRASESGRKEIEKFIKEHREIDTACRFLALREANGGGAWQEWSVSEYSEEELFFWQFVQFELYSQWMDLKRYANAIGVEIIGDIPIYVCEDSADTWSERENFLLDEKGYPKEVAGVPPDYFAKDGQLWGNPLYNYKEMEKDGFSWWKRRIGHALSMFDGVRIDHFRGFESFWSIPATAKTAKDGKYKKGPSKKIIKAIRETAGDKLIIAEDLGDICEDVIKLVEYSKFPGMRVFQFGFLSDGDSPHLPHNYPKNCVAYSGTHDNTTLLAYLYESGGETLKKVKDYCADSRCRTDDCPKEIIKTLLKSHADTVILPIQDILGYGADTRMNTPGTADGNWQYRITREQLDGIDMGEYAYFNKLFGR